jgi:hypothetical protein
MKNLLLALPIFVWVPALVAQDRSKEDVESPLKRAITPAPGNFDLTKTAIEWKKGLDAALNQGKPVLLFQLLGNFDDVYC